MKTYRGGRPVEEPLRQPTGKYCRPFDERSGTWPRNFVPCLSFVPGANPYVCAPVDKLHDPSSGHPAARF